jgi:hypothetical protein
MHYKNIRFLPREGHTEKQIIEYVKDKKLTKEKYQKAKWIKIYIHSKLSTCNPCQNELKNFVEKYKKVHIKQEYDRKYRDYNYSPLPTKDKRATEKKFKYEKSFEEDFKDELLFHHTNSFISSKGADDVRNIIQEVKQELAYKGLLSREVLSSYNELLLYEHEYKRQWEYESDLMQFRLAIGDQYQVQDVAHDGNCFFHVIARRLGMADAYEQIRKLTIAHMQENSDNFQGIEEVLTGRETFEQYINRMYRDGSWVDQAVIQAFANEFQLKIIIVSDGNPDNYISIRPSVIRGNQVNNTIHIGYVNGVHYVSLNQVTYPDDAKDDNDEVDAVMLEIEALNISDMPVIGSSSSAASSEGEDY